jgi:death-on-curing protein
VTRFVRVADLLALAEATLGHPPEVRDLGLLDSAVARPRAAFAGVEAYPSLHLKAAALLESLARNHAFVDGDKRAAFAALLFFYDLNDMRLTLTRDEAFDLVLGVVVHELDIEKAAALLAERTAPR